MDRVHSLLPERIRFKIEYVAEKFIMGNKKHYIALIDGKVKIAGHKAVKSSSCVAAQTLFRWLIDILMEHGHIAATQCYEDALATYASPSHVPDPDLFTCRFSYSGKVYKTGTYKHKAVECMRRRGLELVPGNSLTVVTVRPFYNYIDLFGCYPPIELPSSNGKAERVYAVEEVKEYPAVIDVVGILDTQCGSCFRSVLDSIRTHIDLGL